MNYSDITAALTSAGITVYHPGARLGVCTAPYAVVQLSGTYQYAGSHRLGYTLLTVHCYVPLIKYTELERLVSRVKAALSPLFPELRPTGNEGAHTVNDSFKAHECYVEYMVQRRLF